MARGHEHRETLLASSLSSLVPPEPLTKQDKIKSKQYEKIVRLGGRIVSGSHPILLQPGPAATGEREDANTSNGIRPPYGAAKLPAGAGHASLGSGQGISKSDASTETSLNSTLLKKSEDPQSLEFRVQREKLEHELRGEWEQHRRFTKTSHADPILNLPDIFDRALALVHATASPTITRNGLATDGRAASDSFDDDTFYSSSLDTSDPRLAAQVPSAEATQLAPSPGQGRVHLHPPNAIVVDDSSAKEINRSRSLSGSYEPPPAIPVENHARGAQPPHDLRPDVESALAALHNHTTSGVASFSRDSGYMQAGELQGYRAQHQGQRTTYTEARPPSPLIRAHNLTPAAPQPSHVSSLAINSRLADLQDASATVRAPVAQVAALRQHESTATSPESSPQSGRPFDNRKKQQKKKKRKADRPVESDLLVIKPEPRSPSPINAPALHRPKKRARHGQEAVQEEVRVSSQAQSQLPLAQNYYVEADRDYDSVPSYRGQATTLLANDAFGKDVYEQRPDGSLVRRRMSPSRPVAYYDPMAPQRPRAASHLVSSEPHTGQPRYYREPYDGSISARPEEEYVMAPPRSYGRRIIVDSNGREYIEPITQPPQPPPSVRYSVAPQRIEEPEIVYERGPIRAVSRHPGSYAPDSTYPRHLSQAPARRIVTQPEPLAPQYREYTGRSIGPHGNSLLPPERRAEEELVGNRIVRSSTVRPTSSRYDVAPEYIRMPSVRPPQEHAMVDYRASVRPEYQPEAPQGYMREYRQPTEQGYVRHDFSNRPVERYYEPQPGPGGVQDVQYIERPRRATGEVVYAEPGRGDVYR